MCVAIYKPAGASVNDEILNKCFAANPDGAGFAYLEKNRKRNKVIIERGFFKPGDLIAAYEALEGAVDMPMLIHCRVATHGSIHPDNTHPFPLADGAMIHNGVIRGVDAPTTDRYSHNSIIPLFNVMGACTLQNCTEKTMRLYEMDEPTAKDFVRMSFDVYKKDRPHAAEYSLCETYLGEIEREWCLLTETKTRQQIQDEKKNAFMPSDTNVFAQMLSNMKHADILKAQYLIGTVIGGTSKVATMHDNGKVLLFNQAGWTIDNGVHYSNMMWKNSYGHAGVWHHDRHSRRVHPRGAEGFLMGWEHME